jgi:hypothetical protein
LPEAHKASPVEGDFREEAPQSSGEGMDGKGVEFAGFELTEGPDNMSYLMYAFPEKPGARPE